MTFSRAKASYTDERESILASHMETLDLDQSLMVDAAAGGRYGPSSDIVVNGAGFGSNVLRDVTVQGVLQRSSSGRIVHATDVNDILDTATTQLLDMRRDTYYTALDHAQNITIHLAMSTGFTPIAGDTLQVARVGIPTAPRTFKIYAEDFPAVLLASFPITAGNPAGQAQSNQLYMAEFYFNGTTWAPTRLSNDVV